MYSFPNLEPICCFMYSSKYCFLTCIQISQEAGQVVWYSHLFQNFPQFMVIHTVKVFGIVTKAKGDVFLKLFAFTMIQRILAIWSLVPLSFLNPARPFGSSLFMYRWSLAWRILSNILLASEMSAIVWQFEHSLALPFFGIGKWKWTFFSLLATAEFYKFAGILRAALSQHHLLGFDIAQLEFHYLH